MIDIKICDMVHSFSNKSLKTSVYFILNAHLSLDQPHFKGSAVTIVLDREAPEFCVRKWLNDAPPH